LTRISGARLRLAEFIAKRASRTPRRIRGTGAPSRSGGDHCRIGLRAKGYALIRFQIAGHASSGAPSLH
jgi:hypothetical protein